MKYENAVYTDIKAHVKEHRGWSKDKLEESGLLQRYEADMSKIKEFDGKRVLIEATQSVDWLSKTDRVTGRIKVAGERVMFFEGRKSRHYKVLDAGLYDGWYATLIPLSIEALK